MNPDPSQTSALVMPAPSDPLTRMMLVAIRRMAAHGIRDAHAANMVITTLGIHFRMPLVLLRAFMLEMAQASRRSITLAPCYSCRMTRDEERLMTVLACANREPDNAAAALDQLTAGGLIHPPLSLAATLGDVLAEAGYAMA